jgi:hypothetical protein
LVVEESVVVDASRERVWGVFSDLRGWPEWNFGVVGARFVSGGEWRVGSVFEFTSVAGGRASGLKPVVVECVPGERVTWRGKIAGITGLHTFTFEGVDGGSKTRVTSREVFSGFMLPLARRIFREASVNRVRESFRRSLVGLKMKAEKG